MDSNHHFVNYSNHHIDKNIRIPQYWFGIFATVVGIFLDSMARRKIFLVKLAILAMKIAELAMKIAELAMVIMEINSLLRKSCAFFWFR